MAVLYGKVLQEMPRHAKGCQGMPGHETACFTGEDASVVHVVVQHASQAKVTDLKGRQGVIPGDKA